MPENARKSNKQKDDGIFSSFGCAMVYCCISKDYYV